MEKQYPRRHYRKGIKLHAWIPCDVCDAYEKLPEKILHNRYAYYQDGESEWFEIPKHHSKESFIKEAEGYLNFMRDLLIPYGYTTKLK